MIKSPNIIKKEIELRDKIDEIISYITLVWEFF